MTRKALVIGNGSYAAGHELRNAINDAVAISEALRRNGFEVTELHDLTHAGLEVAALAFRKSLDRDGAGVFYFAGHGIQMDGENFLIGIDSDPTEEMSVKHHSIRLAYVLDLMDAARSETNVIILDACRDNPFGGSFSRSVGPGGLAPVTAPRGTLVAFSTSPGEKSGNGDGSHGRYTEALLLHIDAVCPVESMFKRVRATMAAASTRKQTPWEHTSLISEFYFNRSRNVPITIYSDQAVKDGAFVADPTNPAHSILRDLRTRYFDTQNTAATRLSKADLKQFSKSDCFMIGRALYSAAVGDVRQAKLWIQNFSGNTSSVSAGRRKCLLDGMLFEVFFNGAGVLRSEPKGKWFDTLFSLVKQPALRPSFEFIADTLVNTGRRFHTFPDFEADISIDVMTRMDAGKTNPAVTAIIVNGRDVLVLDSPDYVDASGIPRYISIRERDLGERLADEAALPTLRQVLNYPDLPRRPDELRYPLGYSLAWA